MTEAEWQACDDPLQMLNLMQKKASLPAGPEAAWGGDRPRKLRLFACSCCRAAWHLLADGRSRLAVEAVERDADGEGAGDKLAEARAAAKAVVMAGVRDAAGLTAYAAYGASDNAANRAAAWHVASDVAGFSAWGTAGAAARTRQAPLLRDIVGNPFRPAALPAACRTPQAVTLAGAAYQERDLPSGHLDAARLSILADALEEAGSTDQTIMDHLRGPGPHVIITRDDSC